MKKIFAILIGLLLIGGAFGIASVLATVNGGSCSCQIIGPSTVQVGEEFQVTVKTSGTCVSQASTIKGHVEMISEGGMATPNGTVYTYRAISPGTYKNLLSCGYLSPNQVSYDVTVLSKALPMDKFFKIFGFGNKD